MKICIPTKNNDGLNAKLSVHFGSAPYFTIYDTESQDLNAVKNENQHHEHGSCSPRKVVMGLGVQAVIAAGLGRRALLSLNESGIKVYKTEAKVVSEITNKLEEAFKEEMTFDSACVHGHSQEGSHHQD